MNRQRYILFLAIRHGLTRRLIGIDGHQGNLPRRRLNGLFIKKRQINLFGCIQNGFGLKWGAMRKGLSQSGCSLSPTKEGIIVL